MTGKQTNRKLRPDVDRYGRTQLHYAAAGALCDEVESLLAAGANVNLQDDNGWSPLHFAAQAVSPECTLSLIQAGANLSLRDSFGNTALFRAVFASAGNGAVIQSLLNAGADPNSKNHHGTSPYDLARTIANYDVAQFFRDTEK
ncbi:ankyrin repeat domain-containing protein [Rhodoferax sp. AJA081-3]|uniref:ankyrin repeat domain-containing protein n=1 Tax=Rhodoferax sp. AJA081-3 TaxID=2752316 RepID=UPI001ADF88C8|nr:ankyrin repeat domain-containing protein [Rhodoferax sp. AJA081-3]QTN29585.1 ankyrin repeat domain-containing protein [Rhodoferax sp. AJA081-3]